MRKTLTRKHAIRRAIRKNPTFKEATKMLDDLYDVDYWAWEALDVRDSYRRVESYDTEPRMPGGGTFMFERVVPTLMIIKLSAAVENMLDVLWTRRFPEVKSKSLRYEDKVSVIEKLHDADLGSIRELWTIRNKCAHTVGYMATWGEWEKHFTAIARFVERFPTESKQKH